MTTVEFKSFPADQECLPPGDHEYLEFKFTMPTKRIENMLLNLSIEDNVRRLLPLVSVIAARCNGLYISAIERLEAAADCFSSIQQESREQLVTDHQQYYVRCSKAREVCLNDGLNSENSRLTYKDMWGDIVNLRKNNFNFDEILGITLGLSTDPLSFAYHLSNNLYMQPKLIGSH